MGCVLGVTALWPERAWALGVVAAASFALLVVSSSPEWTPRERFGAANALTTGRLLLVVLMSLLLDRASGLALGTLVVVTLGLDGADGWLARRLALCSEFGAHFDMEVDALLVLTTSVLLWRSGKCGGWVLGAGALRYVYVSCTALWPPRGGVMPRSLLGRSAFFLVVVGHALGFALSGWAATLGAALGTAAVTLSFARSFWYGYGPAAKSAGAS
jgi:phosphatidylglycerophosphate synthase